MIISPLGSNGPQVCIVRLKYIIIVIEWYQVGSPARLECKQMNFEFSFLLFLCYIKITWNNLNIHKYTYFCWYSSVDRLQTTGISF